jgi:hypothetical protein
MSIQSVYTFFWDALYIKYPPTTYHVPFLNTSDSWPLIHIILIILNNSNIQGTFNSRQFIVNLLDFKHVPKKQNKNWFFVKS